MLEGMGRRPLRALQVEVTSRCSRRCLVCPRSGLAGKWRDGDLSPGTWRRLIPDLALCRHLHLQGWGEPLLHEGLRSMVRDAHAAGCRVGITTNGDLLADAAGWIVDERVEVLTVSLAGTGERNRLLRDGADSGALLDALGELARRRAGRRLPRFQLGFLLVRGNASDLPELVRAGAAAGADAVVVNHLDCTPTPELRELSLCGAGPVPPVIRAAVREAEAAARRSGIAFRPPALEPQSMVACALDPRVVASVGWDGRVGPCVQLTMPVDGPYQRWTESGPLDIEAPRFGHLDDAPLAAILAGGTRRDWVEPLHRRCDADHRFRDRSLVASGWGVVALDELDAAFEELDRALANEPLPAACRGCAKAEGW